MGKAFGESLTDWVRHNEEDDWYRCRRRAYGFGARITRNYYGVRFQLRQFICGTSESLGVSRGPPPHNFYILSFGAAVLR